MKERLLKESLRELIPESVSLPDGKLLLAFSGGSDSLFLMMILSILAPGRSAALYVDHALRSRDELDEEIALNRSNAALLGIPLTVVRLPDGFIIKAAKEKGIGIEAAARAERYRILNEFALENGFSRILTAHHREDQVETVVMRILSDSPFYSYQGILENDGIISRPMLSVKKSEILSFLSASGFRWSEDSTNSDTDYLRNRIRHKLIPFLSEEEKACISRIAHNVYLFRQQYHELPVPDTVPIAIDRNLFISSMPFQQDAFIYDVFDRFGFQRRISRKTIIEIKEKAKTGMGRLEIGGLFFYFSRGLIRIFPPIHDFVMEYSGSDLFFQGFCLRHVIPDQLTLVIDTLKFNPPVILRTSREGDRIELKDGSKKVSEIEKDMRVPYSIILEDRSGIIAVFARFAGGRDRLAERYLSSDRKGSALAIEMEYSYIQKDESYGRERL